MLCTWSPSFLVNVRGHLGSSGIKLWKPCKHISRRETVANLILGMSWLLYSKVGNPVGFDRGQRSFGAIIARSNYIYPEICMSLCNLKMSNSERPQIWWKPNHDLSSVKHVWTLYLPCNAQCLTILTWINVSDLYPWTFNFWYLNLSSTIHN